MIPFLRIRDAWFTGRRGNDVVGSERRSSIIGGCPNTRKYCQLVLNLVNCAHASKKTIGHDQKVCPLWCEHIEKTARGGKGKYSCQHYGATINELLVCDRCGTKRARQGKKGELAALRCAVHRMVGVTLPHKRAPIERHRLLGYTNHRLALQEL